MGDAVDVCVGGRSGHAPKVAVKLWKMCLARRFRRYRKGACPTIQERKCIGVQGEAGKKVARIEMERRLGKAKGFPQWPSKFG